MNRKNNVTHLIDYPPRGTACGLYFPKRLNEEGFGSYMTAEVTCKKCLKFIEKQKEVKECLLNKN